MPAIDSRYIVLVGFLIAAFCAVVLFLVRRTFADKIPGLSPWAWGCLLAAIASVLFAVRPATPSTFSIVLANSLLTAAWMLLYVGIREFTGHSANYRLLACAWLAVVCLLTAQLQSGQYPTSPSLITLFNGTVFLASGVAVLNKGT